MTNDHRARIYRSQADTLRREQAKAEHSADRALKRGDRDGYKVKDKIARAMEAAVASLRREADRLTVTERHSPEACVCGEPLPWHLVFEAIGHGKFEHVCSCGIAWHHIAPNGLQRWSGT